MIYIFIFGGYEMSSEQIDKFQMKSVNKSTTKTFLLILFILSFFTLYLALFLVSNATSNNANSAMTENMWLFFLPLPIPLTSLILGVKYKKMGYKATKNIVAGIIFSVLLVLYGSFTFIFSGLYSHDFSFVNQIETQINFNLPDKGNITTQDWTKGEQSGTDATTTHYLYMSDITFTNKEEISSLNKEINSSKFWMTSVSTLLLGEVPSMCSYLTSNSDYNYFMIYNCDLKTYNAIPGESGTYKFIFIAYDSSHGKMKIGEYTLKIVI